MKTNNSDPDYYNWILQLKQKFRQTQIKAAVQVNQELLKFYWDLGADIVEKQETTNWGSKFLNRVSSDLTEAFPEVKGFSISNIKYIRQWYLFYNQQSIIGQQAVGQLQDEFLPPQLQDAIGQQAVAQLPDWRIEQMFLIPWGHHIAIISKCKTVQEGAYYISNTINHGWSRTVLVHQIESGLYHREGKAISNFSQTLPAPQSDLAQQTLKDPYIFDFFTMRADFNERELEKNLIEHITKFLLELGAGFAYMGNQVPIKVGTRDFSTDLLFYQTRLHCYVVVELKKTDFEPEHVGKLNFYIKAIDEQYRQKGDEPTIGLLLCKSKDKVVAEYALSDINKPMGISEYRLTNILPEELKSSLPTIEEIEAEFRELKPTKTKKPKR
jgi:predicted nuclease of restriction endonuclease-like (RecB) superfamily